MRDRAIVSERGTITIPEPIREVAHIHPGDLIEFKPGRNRIILRHLVVKRLGEGSFMDSSEWDKFDKLVQRQMEKGQYTSYSELSKAKQHSRKLLKK